MVPYVVIGHHRPDVVSGCFSGGKTFRPRRSKHRTDHPSVRTTDVLFRRRRPRSIHTTPRRIPMIPFIITTGKYSGLTAPAFPTITQFLRLACT